LSVWAPSTLAQTFDELFEQVRVIELEGSEDSLLTLKDFRVGPDGRFLVTDFYEQHIRVHAPDGSSLLTIRGSDGNPHSQTTRIALTGERIYATCLDTDMLSVLDYKGKKHQSSRPPGFTPNEIQVDDNGNVYLGGRTSRKELPSHGFAIHKFSPDFEYQTSWFRRVPRSETLAGPAITFFGFDIDDEGFLYAVQPLVYGVTKYDRAGEVVTEARWDPDSASYYTSPFEYQGSPSPKAQRGWFRSWTQVLDVFSSDEFVYLVLQTHEPSKYVIEILDKDLNFLVRGIGNDNRLLEVDSTGRLYLLLSDAPDRIGVFKPVDQSHQ
jgi:hypothetical protein